MIIGLSLRHFKSYNNVNYIPITIHRQNKMSMFVGNNGVGKSSILEAFDTFFNGAYWNKTFPLHKIQWIKI
ncbi:AAA family ATPase [Sphingobacterium multivorum]|uniref:AAA family ATPase n=1 Tax=Sphingobacterium multivorum TaxID=28454 RepID=UPI003AFADD68